MPFLHFFASPSALLCPSPPPRIDFWRFTRFPRGTLHWHTGSWPLDFPVSDSRSTKALAEPWGAWLLRGPGSPERALGLDPAAGQSPAEQGASDRRIASPKALTSFKTWATPRARIHQSIPRRPYSDSDPLGLDSLCSPLLLTAGAHHHAFSHCIASIASASAAPRMLCSPAAPLCSRPDRDAVPDSVPVPETRRPPPATTPSQSQSQS